MTVRHLGALLMACLTALSLAACNANVGAGVTADFSSTPTLYIDQYVERPWLPEIYIQPRTAPLEPLTAVLVPLRMRTHYSNAKGLSEELTRVVWNSWLKQRVFPGLVMLEGEKWRGPQGIMTMPSAGGADLVIGGEVTHLMFGGSAGNTELAIRLEIYDAATGDLLWSMAHAGSMTAGLTQDYVFFYKKNRLPSSPMLAVAQALANDIGDPLRNWNYGQPKEEEESSME
ncbi:uncharacterized protein DFE_1917 [Desulfovibrio ferrophilus]|uniref:Lipoprotein n=2 Tax=Desulfovibrio ferrophilus TaxID=241368 RepID=A0A2Z6AZM3_9BACT|nr:uncharacterized protein DFE_1917 [Desulfovibrio ferrophilus]